MSNKKKKRRRKNPPHRPRLTESTQLSDKELEYSRLRSQGYSIHEAAEAIGMNATEMKNREFRWPLLSNYIEKLKGEFAPNDATKSLGNLNRILGNLMDEVERKQQRGDMTVGEIQKAVELSQWIHTEINQVRLDLETDVQLCPRCKGDRDSKVDEPRKLLVNIARDGIDNLSPYWRDRTLCGLRRKDVPSKHLGRWEQLQVNDPEVVIMEAEITRLKVRIHELEKQAAPIVPEEETILQ